MKVTSERGPLADAVTWVAQAISKRPPNPALAGMKIAVEGDQLTLQAFDYDIGHTATLDVVMASSGECLVSGFFLRQILSGMKGGSVDLVLDGDRLVITCGRSTYSTQVLRMDDYPRLPAFPDEAGVVNASALASIVAAVKEPIDDGSPHPQIRGLHLEAAAGELIAVGATRFVVHKAACSWDGLDLDVTVHSKAAVTAIAGLSGDVTIGVKDGLLGFSDDHRAVTLRTYADPYVKWEPLIREPEGDTFALTADADVLLESVKRAGQLSDDETPIELHITPSEVEITVHGSDFGSGSEVVDVDGNGTEELAVNPKYFANALNAVPSGPVSIGVVSATKPLVVRPADHPRMAFVVMPKMTAGAKR